MISPHFSSKRDDESDVGFVMRVAPHSWYRTCGGTFACKYCYTTCDELDSESCAVLRRKLDREED